MDEPVRYRGGRALPPLNPKVQPESDEPISEPLKFNPPAPEQVHSSEPQRHEAPEPEQVHSTRDDDGEDHPRTNRFGSMFRGSRD